MYGSPLGRGMALVALAAVLSASTVETARAAFVSPGLSGTTSYDGWDGLTGANYPGYGGGFPGSVAWPNAITANQPGSGDGTLAKVSGNGYTATLGIYNGGFAGDPNVASATFAANDTTPVAGVKTVVFQTRIVEAFGYDYFNHTAPLLNYSGGSQGLVAGTASLTSQVQTGTFTNPLTGAEEPLFQNDWYYEWNLSSIVDPITALSLTWTQVQHSQLIALQLDQSNVAVPEPSTLVLAGLAGVGLFVTRRVRRARAQR